VPDRRQNDQQFSQLAVAGRRGPLLAPPGSLVERIKRYLLGNFENIFVLGTLVSTAVVNYLVPVKLAFLNFYFLPIILAGYYLGRRSAVLGALLCSLMITVYVVLFPEAFEIGGSPVDVYTYIAAWAGFLYISAPYHISDFFQASLMAEYAAACLVPFAFAFTEKICRGGTRRDIAGLGASYSLVILFDLPIGVIASYALLFYFLVRLDWSKAITSFAKFAAGLGLGLLCSACCLVTVLAELPWLRKDPGSAFSVNTFLFTSFHPLKGDTGIFYMNYLAYATWGLLLPAGILFARQYRVVNRSLLMGVGALTIFSFFMAMKISYPLWLILPKLMEVQQAWRWLIISSIGTSVLLAASIPAWRRIVGGKRRPFALLAIGSVLLSFAFMISHTIREAAYHSPSEVEILSIVVQGSRGLPQWFPIWVTGEIPEMLDEAAAEGRTIEVTQLSPEHRTFAIGTGPAPEVRIRSLYYPHWVATAGGKQLDTHPAPDGVLMISIPPEAVTVNLDFREPPRVLVSGIISVIAWLLLVALFVFGGRKTSNATPAQAETVP